MHLAVTGAPLFGNSQDFGNGLNGVFFRAALGTYIGDLTSIQFNFVYSFYNNMLIDNVAANYDSYTFLPSIRRELISKDKYKFFAEIGLGLGTIEYKANNENITTPTLEGLSGGILTLSTGIGAHLRKSKHGRGAFDPQYRN